MFRRLIAGVALAAALVAPARAAEIDALLPAETDAVMFVNVRQALESDLIKKYALGQLKQALEGNDAQKMMKDLGLDPLKDIDRVTAGSSGKGEDMKAVFVVRGRFDAEKLFSAAEAAAKNNGDKLSIVSEGDTKLVKFTPEKGNQKPIYLSVANEKTVVAATDKALAAATMAAAQKGGKPTLKKDLAALVLKQDEKATMFACAVVEGKIDNLPPGLDLPNVDPAKLKAQLEKLQDLSVTLRLTDDVNLDIAAGMKDADAATDFGATIASLLQTAKALLPLAAGGQPQAKPLIDDLTNTLKSGVKEKAVSISLKLSGDSIAKAAEAGKKD